MMEITLRFSRYSCWWKVYSIASQWHASFTNSQDSIFWKPPLMILVPCPPATAISFFRGKHKLWVLTRYHLGRLTYWDVEVRPIIHLQVIESVQSADSSVVLETASCKYICTIFKVQLTPTSPKRRDGSVITFPQFSCIPLASPVLLLSDFPTRSLVSHLRT